MDLRLTGKVALIVGASRGIGAAIATALAREGCAVAITHWQDATAAGELVRRVQAAGGRAIALESDAASRVGAEQVVAEVGETLAPIEVLVYCAGITADGVSWKLSEADWDRVLDVNLKGCFNYARAATPVFRQQSGGRIVNIASINGIRGKFGQANYAASKGGMIALTKTLARELGKFAVTVNAVAPGMVATDMVRDLPEEFRQRAAEESPLGRIAEPEDIASAVCFLCSEPARHITGVCLQVDGGQAM